MWKSLLFAGVSSLSCSIGAEFGLFVYLIAVLQMEEGHCMNMERLNLCDHV